jgi:subtilisin family serine protease
VYIVTVADPDDESRTKEIRQFLDSKSSGEIAKFHRRRKVVGWGGVELDAAAKAEVQAYEGVEAVFYAPDATLHLLSGESETRSGRFSRSLPKYPAPVKRASTWKKQTDAPKNLVMLGQPPDTKLDGLTDYVYPEYSGEGVYIYVIDTGVQIDVKNRLPEPDNLEFKTEDRKVLRTELSKKHDSDASTDPVGHGTIAASIAAGKQYGVAKGATVIPVKVMPGMNDAFEGLELVFEDIEDNDRFSKSVVLLTRGFSEKITHDNCPQDWRKAWVGYMNDFFNEGVPLVVSAGNTEKGYSEPQKLPMDTAPQVLEDKDTPLINVGAATLAGEHSKSSRAGTQLTVYAPGDPVKAQGRTDGGFVVATGTSEGTHNFPIFV